MKKRSKWKFYHKKEKKKSNSAKKREVSDTKVKEAEKDFVEYYDFSRLWLISTYQNI